MSLFVPDMVSPQKAKRIIKAPHQVADVGVALQKPQQFMNDRTQVQFFCCDNREAFGKIKTHLIAEHTDGSCAGTVCSPQAVIAHMAH